MRSLYLTLFLLCPFSHTKAQTTDSLRIFLNGKSIPMEDLMLLNPKKIIKIEVNASIKECRIKTKKIAFLTYQDIKKQFNLGSEQNPEVNIEGKAYTKDQGLKIDKSFIKKTEYSNGIIHVIVKRKSKGVINPCRGVMITRAY